MKPQKKKIVKLLTPEFRVSHPHLFEKHAFEDQTPKYSMTMLFSKKTDISVLKNAAMKAATELFGPKEEWPETFKWPFKDGDKKKDKDGYPGTIYVKTSSTQPVGVLNTDKSHVTKEENDSGKIIYAGCYAVATVVVSAYDKNGGKGVAFYLNNVMKTRDGKEFSGRASAEEDFASVEVDNSADDPASYESESDEVQDQMW